MKPNITPEKAMEVARLFTDNFTIDQKNTIIYFFEVHKYYEDFNMIALFHEIILRNKEFLQGTYREIQDHFNFYTESLPDSNESLN